MYILNKIACYVHTVFTGPRSSCDSVFELQCYFFSKKRKWIKLEDSGFQKGIGRRTLAGSMLYT